MGTLKDYVQENYSQAEQDQFWRNVEISKLAAILEFARARAQLTLAQLSDATGIDKSELSRYESGEVTPAWDRGMLLLQTLGVQLDAKFKSAGPDDITLAG